MTDDATATTQLLPGSHAIEWLFPDPAGTGFRYVLFDFDGTLSLIREGWRGIMVPMMVEELAQLRTGETPNDLRATIETFVDALTGRQTVYQMIRLCEEIARRGGTPEDPLVYKRRYHNLLLDHIDSRIRGLESGAIPPDDLLLPGSRDLLENVTARGLTLYLASGTDVAYVRKEAALLDIARYFGDRIYGALDDYKSFSKAQLIADLVVSKGMHGTELLGFGDGYVEIENVSQVGGTAVGVASDEAHRAGVDFWKRERLIRAGAVCIIPDFREQALLLAHLFGA